MKGLAVYIRSATKHYGSSVRVLEELDMNVPAGSIYALLGASGCGKTTLLNCIVGRYKLDAGTIRVFGEEPEARMSGSSTVSLGYMPQEIGLLGEFTVKNAVFYFGWLANMKRSDLEAQFYFLSRLLDLPPDDRYIKTLSGGQQRRVSLAAALVNDGELLILDEPTVGLDPILRQTIWDHLTTLSEVKKVTVIITTHYIEEARQAHTIGLLRQGKLLAEDSPQNLQVLHKCASLEAIFFKLSARQSENKGPSSETIEHGVAGPRHRPPDSMELQTTTKHDVTLKEVIQRRTTPKMSSLSRMKALLFKNFLSIIRNPGGQFLAGVIPIMQLSLFFLTIGGHPQGLRLAVVNRELGNYSTCDKFSGNEFTGAIYNSDNDECHMAGLSCLYLSRINDSIVQKEYFEEESNAIDAVRSGKAIAYVFFSGNFSLEMEKRQSLGRRAPPETVLLSEVNIRMDMTDEPVVIMIQKVMYDEFNNMAEDMARACNRSPRAASFPLKFNEPVYGNAVPSYGDSVAPGFILSMTYFVSTTLTTDAITTDRINGIWDRNIIAGVTLTETLFAHMLCQLSCVFVFSVEIVLLSLLVFGLRCNGDVTIMCLMVFLQGVSGMNYGLLISVLCDKYITAVFIAVGSLVPFITLGGMLWPLEGMHYIVRYVSILMPCTLANNSLAHVLVNGWNLLQPQVYVGFLITIAWIIGKIVASLVVLRIKQ